MDRLANSGLTTASVASSTGPFAEASGPPYLVPAGDFDGDGKNDVLEIGSDSGAGFVTARRGSDGSQLWTSFYEMDFGVVIPAELSSAAAYLVAAYRVTRSRILFFGTDDWVLSLDLSAVDRGGTILWTRTYEGKSLGNEYLFPYVGGIANFKGSESTDVLVAIERIVWADESVDESELSLEVLDGDTGTSGTALILDQKNATITVGGFADLELDGLSEYLILISPDQDETFTLPTLQAHRGTDSTLIWNRQVGTNSTAIPYIVSDFTGDSSPDLVLSTWTWEAEGFVGNTFVLEGANGEIAWADMRGDMHPIGDINGDGTTELLSSNPLFSGENIGVLYEAVDRNGPLYQRTHSLPAAQGSPYSTFISWGWRGGDLNNDGIADSGHRLRRTYENGSADENQGAVSGSNGDKLWDGPLSIAAEGSLDGDGDDLLDVDFSGEDIVLLAKDGRTGQTIWTQSIPFFVTYRLDVTVVEVDGDAEGELLLTGPFSHHSGYLLVGESGMVMWPLSPDPWSQTKDYLGGGDLLILGPLSTDLEHPCAHSDIGQGGTCFTLKGGERNVAISIEDESGMAVAAQIRFVTNVAAFDAYLCGSGAIDVPVGTRRMWVRVLSDEGYFCQSPAVPIRGRITASFS